MQYNDDDMGAVGDTFPTDIALAGYGAVVAQNPQARELMKAGHSAAKGGVMARTGGNKLVNALMTQLDKLPPAVAQRYRKGEIRVKQKTYTSRRRLQDILGDTGNLIDKTISNRIYGRTDFEAARIEDNSPFFMQGIRLRTGFIATTGQATSPAWLPALATQTDADAALAHYVKMRPDLNKPELIIPSYFETALLSLNGDSIGSVYKLLSWYEILEECLDKAGASFYDLPVPVLLQPKEEITARLQAPAAPQATPTTATVYTTNASYDARLWAAVNGSWYVEMTLIGLELADKASAS